MEKKQQIEREEGRNREGKNRKIGGWVEREKGTHCKTLGLQNIIVFQTTTILTEKGKKYRNVKGIILLEYKLG